MKKSLLSFALIIVLTLPGLGVKALDIKNSERKNGLKTIRIENDFYKIEICPEAGGKIISWFDKKKGAEMAFWKDVQDKPAGELGMLDDRGCRTYGKYEAEILKQDKKEIILKLTNKGEDGLEVSKTLTFRNDSPVVNAKYLYSNHAQKSISGFKIGVKNFISPGGQQDSVTEEDIYYIPTTHTIRRIKGFLLKGIDGKTYPELKSKLKTAVARPWAAFIDAEKKQGFAVSLEDDFYSGWYMWKSYTAKPTFEWMFGELPGGYSRETEFNLIQVDGLSGLVFASPEILADMHIEPLKGRLSILTSVCPLISVKNCILKTRIRQIGRAWSKELPDIKLDFKEPYEIKKHLFDIELSIPNGLLEIEQTVLANGKILAKWPEAVPIGDAITEPLYQMKRRGFKNYKAIPGWQAENAAEMKPDAQDKKNGFMFVPANSEPQNGSVKLWTVDMSKNEFESIPFLYAPLKYFDKASVFLEGGKELNARLRVQVDEEFDARKSGAGIKYSHLLFDKNTFDGSQKTKIWLTLGNGNLTPGKYSLKIKLKPDGSNGISLPVAVNVCDVPLPHRKLVSLEAEGYPMSIPHCQLALQEKRDNAVLNKWFDNMTSHGIDFFQEIGWLSEKSRTNKYIKIMGSNVSLAEDMKKRPEFYSKGENLPELDFSAMDFYFDPAISKGLTRFKMSHYDVSKPTPVRKWLYKQAADYLKLKGYSPGDMFVKVLDEQPPNRFPAMAETAKWLKTECGFRPFSTFHHLFAEPEQLKILNPYFDMYQGGYTNREELAERIRQGLIDPDDEILVYTGSGTMTKTYEELFAHGWNAAFHKHRSFHNHEYMRGGNKRKLANIIFIDEDNLPVDSPAFEGLRDGMECANLIALYREWKKLLKNEKGANALFADLDKKMSKIFGESKEAIIKFKKEKSGNLYCRKIEKITPKQAKEAHEKLLRLLDELGRFARKSGNRYAKAEWNGVVFFDKGKAHLNIVPAGNKKDEKTACDFFADGLARALGVSPQKLLDDKNDKKVKLIFRLERNKSKMPYTYTVNKKSPEKVVVTGDSEKNLKTAAENLIKLTKISGVWN